MIKKVAAIVAVFVIASICVASFAITTTPSKSNAAAITSAHLDKRLNYGPLFGRVSCEPGWTYGTQFLPTNGTGTYTPVDCNGSSDTVATGASNQLAYMANNSWGVILTPTAHMIESYPSELATLGQGHTEMDTFKNVYVNYMDQYHIKWWLGIDLVMADESVLTYQTPGYNSTHYTPASGMATSYESEFGPSFDFIEHNCSTNFQGYTFEQAYTNGVSWLHNRTNYSVSEKDWSGWNNNLDSRGENVLMGTNADGTDISPMPTPLQRVGMLDELTVEIFNQQFFTDWSAFLPKVRAAYPNLSIILNVDQVCANEKWSNGAPYENGSDLGWWAPHGLGEPTNRCYAEQQGALHRIISLREINGRPFDGVIYNFVGSAFPEGGSSVPDITWFLEWADTTFQHGSLQWWSTYN